jgi:type IV pilus assembly protein PilY1
MTDDPGTSRADLRINTVDFDAALNPSQYRCQDNNILIISDGQPTAEKQADVVSLVSHYSGANGDGDTQTGFTATCPKYHGTMNLDDLAWLAKNRNIKTFSKTVSSTTQPANSSEQITTYVVYTGPSTALTTEATLSAYADSIN